MLIFLISLFITFSQASQGYTDILISDLNKNNGVKFTSQTPNDNFGYSLKGGGDFNNDGYNDVLIGSYGTNSLTGTVYVVFGNKDGLTDAALSSDFGSNKGMVIYGANVGDYFGAALSFAGDINNDGVDDIIIGTLHHDQGTGIAYVIYGSKNPPAIIDLAQGLDKSRGFTIVGEPPNSFFGISVSQAGDVSNDKIDDLIIGSVGVAKNKGVAYVIFGRKGLRNNILLASGLDQSDGFAIFGAADGDNFGQSVSRAGDINGDGIEDVVIGAYAVNGLMGAAYVIYGSQEKFGILDLSKGLSQSKGFVITGLGYLGMFVGDAGDFNGDGAPDIILGAGYEGGFRGAAYVIYGRDKKNSHLLSDISLSSGLDPTRGVEIKGAKSMSMFGISGSSIGDMNRDGIDDIVIGTSGYAGASYVIFGSKEYGSEIDISSGLEPGRGFLIIGENSGDALGMSVSAGDLNQDGMLDVIVGAYGVNNLAGAAYIVFSPLICSERCISCTATWACLVCEKGMELVNGYCLKPKSPLDTAVKISEGLFDSGSTASRLFTMGRSLSVGLGLMAKIIQNVRFLNISYPKETLSAFENYGTDLFELPIPEILYESPETKGLPIQYAKYDINPTFLENYWQTFMTILISLMCFLVIKLIQYLTKKQNKKHVVRVALKNIGQTCANFLIIQIYSNLDDVIFYFLLDVSSTKMSSPSAGISIGAAAFFLLLGFSLVIFHCWVLGKYQQAKKEGNLENFQKKFQIIGTLFEDFKDDNTVKQSFFGILILRCVFLVLVIMLLQPPWIQASLLMFTNLVFLGYFIYQRPFKSRFDEISQYFCEITIFAAYLGVLVLSILDYQNKEASSARNGFGKCIVLAGIVLSLGGFVIQLIQIIGAIYGVYQFFKGSGKKKDRKVLPLQNNNHHQKCSETSNLSIQRDNSQIDELELSRIPLKNLIAEPRKKLKISSASLNYDDTLVLDNSFTVVTQANKLLETGKSVHTDHILQKMKTQRDTQVDNLNRETEILEASKKRKKIKTKPRNPDSDEA